MSTGPNYFITGVWKDDHKRIAHVFLHQNTHDSSTGSNTFNPGIKTLEATVVRLCKAGNLVMTLRWDYLAKTWTRGAKVEVISLDDTEYLRTHKDAMFINNLDNMINMKGFF